MPANFRAAAAYHFLQSMTDKEQTLFRRSFDRYKVMLGRSARAQFYWEPDGPEEKWCYHLP